MGAKLIEKDTQEGCYGFNFDRIIVDHPTCGRLLLVEGWGGDDINGETYRWRNGLVIQLKTADTLSSLDSEAWNDYCSAFQAITHGHDDSRPILLWDGFAIDKLVNSL